MGAPIEIGRDEARRRAEEELAKAKYQGMPDWLSDILQRLQELLDGLLNPQVNPGGSGSGIVFVIVLVLVLLALVLIVWKVGLPRWRPAVADAEVETDPEVEPDQYRSAAERAAASQDWSAAIRERFRGLVRELEHRTIVDPRPGRTALEAAGRAALMLPEVEADLHTAALGFNDVMYGQVVADRARYETMVAADTAVTRAASRFRHDRAASPEPSGGPPR